MKLSEILTHVTPIKVEGPLDIEIASVKIDSRQVTSGDLFMAVRGTQTDGHQYISKAIQQGAACVVCEEIPKEEEVLITWVVVKNTEEVVGQIATQFYGSPSEHLKLVGVTGTNGKTTIATLLYKTFRGLGYRCGLLSTVCNYVEETAYPATQTTPDPITLNQLLATMVQAGCQYAFMEVSSHSVAQHRIAGLKFAGGVFTNLTRDHLDYHKTFENYRDCKKKFFDELNADAFAVTNADDRNGLVMTQNSKAHVYTYSQHTMADVSAQILEMSFQGMDLRINGIEVSLPLVGPFNVSNALAIYATALALGEDKLEVLRVLSMQQPVAGRFETLHSPKGFTAIVDYAHTPDALVNVLSTIQEIVRHRGNIITVCGAGGNRDKGKRPQMAAEAAKASDKLILTSDNPRFENPVEILQDMVEGLTPKQKEYTLVIEDRRQAIRTACMLAQKGDVVLVAGKGHENYQDIQGVKHHFDDKEELQAMFN